MSNSETEWPGHCGGSEEAQRVLSVCHVLRYTPFYRTIKQLIDDGQVGEVASLSQVENVGVLAPCPQLCAGQLALQ